MRWKYLLPLAFLGMAAASMYFAFSPTSVTDTAQFSIEHGDLRIKYRIRGRQASLARIDIYDDDSGVELGEYSCGPGRIKEVNTLIHLLDENRSENDGEERPTKALPQHRDLRVVFTSYYVPSWLPALSGWTTIYRVRIRANGSVESARVWAP